MNARKILTLIIAILVLLTVHGAYADASELKFGMTKTEVVAIMGNGSEPAGGSANAFTTLFYRGQRISKYEDAMLTLYFEDDKLCLKMYDLIENYKAPKERYNYLLKALEGKYGEPDAQDDVELFQLFYQLYTGSAIDDFHAKSFFKVGYGTLTAWTDENNTRIVLVNFNSGYSMTDIIYFATDNIPEMKYNDDGL